MELGLTRGGRRCSVRWLVSAPVPPAPAGPLRSVPREESMIRTPLYAALLVALSQPAFAQSPAAPPQPRTERPPTSAPADDAAATAGRDCCGKRAAGRPALFAETPASVGSQACSETEDPAG